MSNKPGGIMMSLSRKSVAVLAVYLGTCMATVAISIVTVALPAIQAGLGAELAGLQWVVGAYALSLSACMLSAGPIGDRYGRKRAWLFGIVLFTLGSATSATAPSLAILIAGCALQGVAGALVIPGALSILAQAFPNPAERAQAIGGWSSFSAVSLILGPMLGGILVDTVDWRSVFLINLPVGAVALGLGLVGIDESADPDHAALDPAGQVLSVVLLGALTYGFIAASGGWTAPATLSAFGVAGAALLLFVVVERRAARPLVPVDLFRDLAFVAVNFASFALGFSGYSSLFLFSLFLQQAQGWSAAQAGSGIAPVFVVAATGSLLFGRWAARFGLRRLMIVGYVLLGVAMLGMSSFTEATPYAVIAPLFALLGAGLGLSVPATGASTMAVAPRERSGIASATMNALRQSGMTISIALLGTVLATTATASLTSALMNANVGNAAELAAIAIRRHEMPGGLGIAPDTFHAMLASALARGFSAAAALAGLFALLAAAMLAAAALQARRAQPGSALARET